MSKTTDNRWVVRTHEGKLIKRFSTQEAALDKAKDRANAEPDTQFHVFKLMHTVVVSNVNQTDYDK